MGVKGLKAYVQQCCPNALVNVNLHRLARQYQEQHGRQPVLVFDGMTLLNKFYHPGIPWVFGGEWLELFERIQTFLETLKKASIKPVFIFDGVVEQSKRVAWLDRRKKERKVINQVFAHIRRTGQHPDKRLYHIPPSLTGCLTKALTSLGAEVSRSIIKADKEIFQYYKKHQCLGVLTHDSDFLIYDVDNYFSSETLNLSNLYCKVYNKEILCRHLGLHRNLLPLLACILGNDTISPNSLTRFHHWVTGTPRDGRLRFQTTVPCCAEFLARHGINQITERLIYDVQGQVFRFPRMEGVFQQVIHEYTSTDDSVPNQPEQQNAAERSATCQLTESMNAVRAEHQDMLEIVIEKKGANFVKKVLKLAETDCNMSFEDDTDYSMPSAALVLRPIRERVYGVILGVGTRRGGNQVEAGSNSGEDLVVGVNAVNEYYTYAGYPLKDPDVVAATHVNLPGSIPSLEDLWTKPEVETLHLRQQVVLSCLYCNNIDETLLLQTLPQRYLALCCLIHYLVTNGPDTMLRESDVDAFIAQAVCLRLHTAKSIWDLGVVRVDPRGVHLATIFMRGLSTFWEVNASCADPFKMEDSLPWQCFDGKLFHVKYLMAQDGAPAGTLCQDDGQAVEEFQLLKKCITNGTRMEMQAGQS